jgi:hypothetical protein
VDLKLAEYLVDVYAEADDYGCFVTLKPTEAFAANPLFEPVSETEVYKEWVGEEVEGCLSDL